MSRKIDFLILVENVKRGELENACLLKQELNNRGYTAKISYYRRPLNIFENPRVVIVPDCYSDDEVAAYAYFTFKKEIKIVNLQYEQVLSQISEGLDMYKISGLAQKALHLTWGNITKERLKSYGIKETNTCVTGSMSMDFYNDVFASYYDNRQEMAGKYNLPSEKKWFLFASNFTLIDEGVFENSSLKTPDANLDMERKSMIDNKNIFLEWIEKNLPSHQEMIFIYRPHPVEKEDINLHKIEEKYSNFRVISEKSLKQWVNVVDCLMVYMSTSIVDAYYCGIPAYIIRPVWIDPKIDAVIMNGAKTIQLESEFENVLNENMNYKYPINDTIIQAYYGGKTEFAFKRIADVCEKMYNDNENNANEFTISMKDIKKLKTKSRSMKNRIMSVFQQVNCWIPLYWLFKDKKVSYNQLEMDYMESKWMREQKEEVLGKIRKCI